MKELRYSIADDIFKQHPEYARGVVVAFGVNNNKSSTELDLLLRHAEDFLRMKLIGTELVEHPRIKSWREAYRSFGSKPSEFRSSVEAMARRVMRNESIPSISSLVDIGNSVSLKYLLPIGAHDVDMVKEDLSLRTATGNETFVAFGSELSEHPQQGEIVFTDGNVVLTRRWTWRQANHTLTHCGTRAVEFNIDGLAPVTKQEIDMVCLEIMSLTKSFCGGRSRYCVLCKDNPKVKITWD